MKYWDEQYNPVTGCDDTFECWRRCWARERAAALEQLCGGTFAAGTLHPKRLAQMVTPPRVKAPELRLAAICWLGDLWATGVPESAIDAVLGALGTWGRGRLALCLTKRTRRMREYFSGLPGDHRAAAHRCWTAAETVLIDQAQLDLRAIAAVQSAACGTDGIRRFWPFPHVLLGASVTRAHETHRIGDLADCPAGGRWVSLEPLLEAVDVRPWLPALDWVVVGGETGRDARPLHPDWVRDIRDACAAARVPFLFKGWGGTARGRELDGRTHDERPMVARA